MFSTSGLLLVQSKLPVSPAFAMLFEKSGRQLFLAPGQPKERLVAQRLFALLRLNDINPCGVAFRAGGEDTSFV
jgi:hypothetical protein